MSIIQDILRNDPKTEPDTGEISDTTQITIITTISPEEQKKTREKALADRALERMERKEKNHALAEDLCKAGDALVEIRDYAGACANYVNATNLWSSNSSYYLKLTAAYLKCELYVEATHAATRALSLEPKSLQARYSRGVARLEQRLLPAAKLDFETVLKHDPSHADAQISLSAVVKLLGASTKLGELRIDEPLVVLRENSQDIDFDFPRYNDDKLELASVSDSSDCNHIGNGIPCRFYNHEGCARGNDCVYSHAPDERSVRDNLGKNVCIYYLLSSCKFGAVKCIYAHSKEDLPTTQGWWNDERQIKKVRGVLEMAEKNAKEQRALDTLLRKLETKAKKARGGKKKDEVGKQSKKNNTEGKRSNNNGHQSSNQLNIDAETEERTMNRGDNEVHDSLSQGVKPRETGAPPILKGLTL